MLVSDVLMCVPGGVCSVSRQCREIIAILDTWGSRFIQVQTHHTHIEVDGMVNLVGHEPHSEP
jgi:hypothetical protein